MIMYVKVPTRQIESKHSIWACIASLSTTRLILSNHAPHLTQTLSATTHITLEKEKIKSKEP